MSIVVIGSFCCSLPLPLSAQTLSPQQYANQAAAAADSADRATVDAKDALDDAEKTLVTDQNNGANSAQLQDDGRVADATSQAYYSATAADKDADQAASRAQTDASAGNGSAAMSESIQAQGSSNLAQDESGLAQKADENKDDAYGDPNSAAGLTEHTRDDAEISLVQASNNLASAEVNADANPNDPNAQTQLAGAQGAFDTALSNFKSAGMNPDTSSNSSSSADGSSSDDKF